MAKLRLFRPLHGVATHSLRSTAIKGSLAVHAYWNQTWLGHCPPCPQISSSSNYYPHLTHRR